MRRSSIFMSVLLSLFIFQSIWNVAAAYCAHEQTIEPLTITTHFGHHDIDKSSKNQDAFAITEQDSDPVLTVNHHDHLPSCFQLAVFNQQNDVEYILSQVYELKQKYTWLNFYQSPDLFISDPPPVFTLL
ncbi:cation efflux protein, CzcI-like [Acinetobacter junii]|uniref:cation efflux protein, CzcI-like n=1 Tax=Acinetobacter junii TaxID=40215 RepID=UPI003215D039